MFALSHENFEYWEKQRKVYKKLRLQFSAPQYKTDEDAKKLIVCIKRAEKQVIGWETEMKASLKSLASRWLKGASKTSE